MFHIGIINDEVTGSPMFTASRIISELSSDKLFSKPQDSNPNIYAAPCSMIAK
jgi:hypothetical protein